MEEKITTTKMVAVTNRDNGEVFAKLSGGRTIDFNRGQTKKVSLDDLAEINSTEGGRVLLREYLVIGDKAALDFLEMQPEPEYYYSEKEIKKLLTEGSLDQLEDCLNFAPEGVLNLLKDMALEMEIPDVRKRKLIAQKTGFNIDNILQVKAALDVETGETGDKEEKKTRKAEPIKSEPKRKSTPIAAKTEYPEYKVVSTK